MVVVGVELELIPRGVREPEAFRVQGSGFRVQGLGSRYIYIYI